MPDRESNEDQLITEIDLTAEVIDVVDDFEKAMRILTEDGSSHTEAMLKPEADALFSLLDNNISLIERVFGFPDMLNDFIYDNDCGRNGFVQVIGYSDDNGNSFAKSYELDSVSDFIEMAFEMLRYRETGEFEDFDEDDEEID